MALGWKARTGIALGGLVVVLGGGTIASAMMDADWLRTRIVTAVERQTGRTLRIDAIHVWILPFPWVDARGISFADQPGGSRAEMFTAKELRARLSLSALLGHEITLEDVSLISPSLSLERMEDGRANWQFTPEQQPASSDQHGTSSAGMRWNFAIANAHVHDGALVWSDRLRHLTGALTVDSFDGEDLTSATPHLLLAAHHDKGAITLTGTTGALPPGAGAWPVHLTLALASGGRTSGKLQVNGQITNPMQDAGYDLHVTATLAQAQDLESLFPRASLPDAQNLAVDAQVTGSGKLPALTSLHVQSGPIEGSRLLDGLSVAHATMDAAKPDDRITVAMDGTLSKQAVSLLGQLGTLDQSLAAWRNPEAAPLPVQLELVNGETRLKADGTLGGGNTNMAVHGALPVLALGADRPSVEGLTIDGTLQSAAPLSVLRQHDPLTLLHTVSFTLDLAAPHVTWRSVAWTSASAHVTLKDAHLVADPVHATGSSVQQAGTFSYDASGRVPHLTVNAAPVVLPAEAVEQWAGVDGLVSGSLQLVGSVAADGSDMAAWQQSLAGHGGASMVGGRVGGHALASLVGRGIPIHGAMNLRCFGVHFGLGSGQATLDRIGLEADAVSLSGHGTVGLGDGALNLHLSPRIGLGGAAASSAVGVTGTLENPVPNLEAGSDGRVGITIGGSQGQPDPCPDLLAAAREGQPGPAASAPPPPQGNKVMDLLRSFGIMR